MAYNAVIELIKRNAYDCLFLVNPKIQVLDGIRDQVLVIPSVCEINIGKKLSTSLLATPLNDPGRSAQRRLAEEIESIHPELPLCTHIDFLFEPGLGIDPFMLFRQVARNTRLIALWPGDYSSETLSYAVPEHGHYRIWHVSDPGIMVYRLDG